MLRILLKKQMTEVFKGYFYDAKKNKKRSTLSTVSLILLFVALMVGVIGGMFTALSIQLCKPFINAGMDWLYFLIMGLLAISYGAIGGAFNSYYGLYVSKDNDLLLSMPISAKSIIVARLTSTYLIGFMYAATVIVPAIIVYWVVKGVSLLNLWGGIALIVIISVMVLDMSCLIGWCMAKAGKKLKNKSFISVILALLFMGLYYFVFFKVQGIIKALIINVAVYGKKIRNASKLVYMFGKIGEGNLKSSLLYLGIVIVLLIAVFYLVERSFIGIVTFQGAGKKKSFVLKSSKKRTGFMALLSKEFGRFTASPNYMINCGMGVIFIPVAGIFFLIKGDGIINTISKMLAGKEAEGLGTAFFVAAICLLVSMNDMVVPSVSLEGKNIWIVQSLPVNTWDVLKAKLMVQLILTGIPVIFCDICMAAVLDCSLTERMLAMLVPLIYVIFLDLFGLFMGLNMSNLVWTNELAPIKQSMGVMISMFGGWALAFAMGAIYAFAGYRMGISTYLVIVSLILGTACAILYGWLKRKGSEKFASL